MLLRSLLKCARRSGSLVLGLASSEVLSRDMICCVSRNSYSVALRCRRAGD